MKYFAALLFALLCAAPLQASLLNTNITLRYDLGGLSTTDVFTAMGGADLVCPGAANVCSILTSPTQTISVGANTITWLYNGPGTSFSNITPNAFNFLNLNPGFAIDNVLLTTNIPGLDSSRVSFTDDSVRINMTNVAITGPSSSFQLGLQPVPEPAAYVLFGTGLAIVLAARRRR